MYSAMCLKQMTVIKILLINLTENLLLAYRSQSNVEASCTQVVHFFWQCENEPVGEVAHQQQCVALVQRDERREALRNVLYYCERLPRMEVLAKHMG